MPASRIGMRKIKDILRLRWAEGLPVRQVPVRPVVRPRSWSRPSVRAKAADLDWPRCERLDEAQLKHRLYGRSVWWTFTR